MSVNWAMIVWMQSQLIIIHVPTLDDCAELADRLFNETGFVHRCVNYDAVAAVMSAPIDGKVRIWRKPK